MIIERTITGHGTALVRLKEVAGWVPEVLLGLCDTCGGTWFSCRTVSMNT